jgi:MEMO1 family protein
MKNVREPAVAGMFYPSSPRELKEQISTLLDSTQSDETFENPFGIVSPHAGYVYSGKTAAHAYNTIRGKNFSTVVIISPSHREYFPGVSIYNGDAYRTPLGEVPLNKEMISKLSESSKIIFEGTNGHRSEHAVEVQIPFLQIVLKDFRIVPIVVGDQRKIFIYELAEKLAKVVDENTLIVASSDLSHFHTKQEADYLDSIVEKRIIAFEHEKLLQELETESCEACGGGPIAAMLKAADLCGKKKSKILSRSDSGDITGDSSEVVGYLSAIIYS